MMRKIISLMVVAMLCMVLVTTVCASEADGAFVFDDAGILTDSEEAALENRLRELSHTYQAQIAIAAMDSLEGADIDDYLDFAYDSLALGYGENNDGVLLLISMNDRDFRILSKGLAGDAITGSDIDTIGNAMESQLSAGNYSEAFHIFADKCDYYLDGHINGQPFPVLLNLLIALVVGLIIALIVTGVWKGQLKSVRRQNQANAYVKAGTMEITQSGDFFMYRNVTRTERPRSNSSSGGGTARSTGGGSF